LTSSDLLRWEGQELLERRPSREKTRNREKEKRQTYNLPERSLQTPLKTYEEANPKQIAIHRGKKARASRRELKPRRKTH
jgi:phosphopantetheinyl transferase